LISSKEPIVAIGEIGLDYAKLYQKNKTSQLKIFQAQVALAEKYKLPVSIHCYKAFDDLYSILNQTKVQGVLHGFNQSYQLAMQFIKLGFKIGVGSLILHSQTKLNKTVKLLPIESLVLETDYPHVNLAQSLLILEEIAKIKKLPISIVEETLYHNATQIFKRRVIS
jgi:TatD DNase family protein